MPSPVDDPTPVLYKGRINIVLQTVEFAAWLTSQKDARAKARIFDRLLRVADGNFGDSKSVAEGVSELRMHFGPGYRVYFRRHGDTIVLLLVGGDKSSQRRDIAKALELAKRDDDAFGNDTV